MYNRCQYCYYGNLCPASETCDNYTPITEEAEDLAIANAIEQGREEYRIAWNTYIREY